MKKFIALSLALALTLSVCACSKKKDTAPSVYFINTATESSAVYREIAEEYTKQTGVEVEIKTVAAGEYGGSLQKEFSSDKAPTIFELDGPVGYKSWQENCKDLSDTALYESLSDKNLAMERDGKVYGIPYAIDGYGIIYNKDVTDRYFALDGAKFNSMDEINSFEKFKTLVSEMTLNKEKLGIDGVFASTSLEENSRERWHTHLFNIPMYYEFGETGTAMGAETTDFKYSDNYREVFDLYLDNSVTERSRLGTKTYDDAVTEFAQGRCAMLLGSSAIWGRIESVSESKVGSDSVGMMPVYIGVKGEENQGICIGTQRYIAINSKSSDADAKAAADFLSWLFMSETGKGYLSDKLGIISPFEGADTPNNPLSAEVIRWRDGGKNNVGFVAAALPSQDFKDALGEALSDYALGKAEWSEVTDIVKDKWVNER